MTEVDRSLEVDRKAQKKQRGKKTLLYTIFVLALMWILTVLTTKPLPSNIQPTPSKQGHAK